MGMDPCLTCCPVLKGRSTKKIVLLLVGLDNAGKTTTARNLAGGSIDDVIPTVGFSSVKLRHRGMEVTLFDLGGGSQIRAIWKSYFSDVHGVIFVLDASDVFRIGECKEVLEELLSDERLAGKPVLVLANKQDQPGALDQVDLVESLQLETLVNRHKCLTLIEECSASQLSVRNKIDPRLLSGYRWLVNQVSKDYESLNARVERDRVTEAERLATRRKALRAKHEARDRLENNGLTNSSSYRNGDVSHLPYKNNIIQVSPPPGVQVIESDLPEKPISPESNVGNLTKNIKDQLERFSINERQKNSLIKQNKVRPVAGAEETERGRRPRGDGRPQSEPRNAGGDRLELEDLDRPSPPYRRLPPLRPLTSKSLGVEGRGAWDLDKELDVVLPPPNWRGLETSQVCDFKA